MSPGELIAGILGLLVGAPFGRLAFRRQSAQDDGWRGLVDQLRTEVARHGDEMAEMRRALDESLEHRYRCERELVELKAELHVLRARLDAVPEPPAAE